MTCLPISAIKGFDLIKVFIVSKWILFTQTQVIVSKSFDGWQDYFPCENGYTNFIHCQKCIVPSSFVLVIFEKDLKLEHLKKHCFKC